MDWKSASEIVAGLAYTGRVSNSSLRPEAFISPYDVLVKDIKEGRLDKEELILKVGSLPIQTALHAQENINGLGKTADWVTILESAYATHIAGIEFERLGRDMQHGKEPDPARLAYLTRQFQSGKTDRMPLSKIEPMEMPFIESGWRVLDDHLGGFPEVGLIVVGGNPGVGKTSWMAKVASSFVKRHPDKRVGVYSLEMIFSEIALRFNEVSSLTQDEKDRLEINEKPLTASQVIADASLIDSLGLVIVDFADLMVRGEITESSMGEIYRTLAIGAKELHCPIILLSQLNRSYRGGVPRPVHIRYTSLAEILSWMLIMLYNPTHDFYDGTEDMQLPVPRGDAAYIIAWKIRGGFRLHPDDSPGAILTPFKGSKGWHSDKSKWFSLKKEV